MSLLRVFFIEDLVLLAPFVAVFFRQLLSVVMLLIAAEETAGNRPTLRLDLRSFEGMFLDPHPLRDFPPETSASTIPCAPTAAEREGMDANCVLAQRKV